MYCRKCGHEIDDEAVICVYCGCQVNNFFPINNRSWVVTLLLCIFCGGVSAHRFYTGYIGIGILQILTFQGLGLWWLIDLIAILCRVYRTRSGDLLQ